jgi:hypothetical protein
MASDFGAVALYTAQTTFPSEKLLNLITDAMAHVGVFSQNWVQALTWACVVDEASLEMVVRVR